MPAKQDFSYMSLALKLAKKGQYTVSPNPMVGCVIVKNNKIIGQGFHEAYGENHAEINALAQAGKQAKNAVLYVTLEPCCHQGKTPPCLTAVIASGIKKIYIACLDPNPLVAGKSIEKLKQAGIVVKTGLCEQKAKNLNKIFFYYMTHQKPYVILKWAMSLDGKTIAHPEDAREISGQKAFQNTHLLRARVDAVVVGAQTVLTDNPSLTCRLPQFKKLKNFHQPLRIIVTSHPELLPDHLNIFNPDAKTLITAPVKNKIKNKINYIILNQTAEGKVDLHALLSKLGKMGISSILVEGGMTLHESFINENLVNQIQTYLCPVIIGRLKKKYPLNINHIKFKKIGQDVCITTDYSSHLSLQEK